MKVFIFDPLWSKLIDKNIEEKLEHMGAKLIIVEKVKPLSEFLELFEGNEERLLCLNPDYVGWKLQAKDYENIPNLKGILTASTGYEWIDQTVANDKNIPICNIKNFSTQSVAEWAILMAVSLARQIPRLMRDGFPLDYDKDYMKYRGVELKGKKTGVIGLGNIGSAIAERCKGLGMEVLYYSKNSKREDFTSVSIEDVFRDADFVFPTMAKNQETIGLITDDMLRSMKPSAILVDIAHGLLNEQLVLEMVKEGRLFGYGYEAKTGEFAQHEGNIWSVPAYAWATAESMYNSEDLLVENILSAVKDKFPNRVN